jgi:hypothetical protein
VARTTLLAVCLGLTLNAPRAPAQETYTVRLKPPGAGETTRYEDTLTTEMTTRQVDGGGEKVRERRDHSVRRAVYQETVLERDPGGGQVKRFRRQCDSATLQLNQKESQLPYHGRAFVVERGPEGCRVRFEGPPPPGDFVRDLEEGFTRKKDVNLLEGMLPGKALKVGETWSFDPRPLLQAWPKPAQVRTDPQSATGAGKLTRVYRRDGRLFGVLGFTVEVPVLGVDYGSRPATLEPGARMGFSLTVDACIDGGASTFSLRMEDELRVLVRLPGPQGLLLTGSISEQHLRTETRP